ncbi:hypothetical protein GXW71_22810 [Roseomonas hellenica]|uniref:Uncharacterized protein n=1 Tax=Plastoroseomonas hellenica TaxID=2687306 RepID=A0ABS5F3U3_9PROT|nr:hypothetical protein [Plastoroseomonas hellenica]MBR0667207.1 hypothetical protein [Plastoroseomonas hellenica]
MPLVVAGISAEQPVRQVRRCLDGWAHIGPSNGRNEAMLRGGLLWLIGIPLPIILLLWLFGALN